jgi:hypothetical protein
MVQVQPDGSNARRQPHRRQTAPHVEDRRLPARALQALSANALDRGAALDPALFPAQEFCFRRQRWRLSDFYLLRLGHFYFGGVRDFYFLLRSGFYFLGASYFYFRRLLSFYFRGLHLEFLFITRGIGTEQESIGAVLTCATLPTEGDQPVAGVAVGAIDTGVFSEVLGWAFHDLLSGCTLFTVLPSLPRWLSCYVYYL